MKKLLIFSTLLICLTANPKTFSAKEKKQYRLIRFTEKNQSDDRAESNYAYVIAQSGITNNQIDACKEKAFPKSYNKSGELFSIGNGASFGKFTGPSASKFFSSDQIIQAFGKCGTFKYLYVLRIIDVNKHTADDNTGNNIEPIHISMDNFMTDLGNILGTDMSNDDDIDNDKQKQPNSSTKEGSMGKASKNEKTDISMDPNNSPFTTGEPEGNTSSNNEEKDDNSSTSSGINKYHIGSVIILVGVLFFVVLNWSNLSKSSKKESVDNTH